MGKLKSKLKSMSIFALTDANMEKSYIAFQVNSFIGLSNTNHSAFCAEHNINRKTLHNILKEKNYTIDNFIQVMRACNADISLGLKSW